MPEVVSFALHACQLLFSILSRLHVLLLQHLATMIAMYNRLVGCPAFISSSFSTSDEFLLQWNNLMGALPMPLTGEQRGESSQMGTYCHN